MPVQTKFVDRNYLNTINPPVSHESAIQNMYKVFDKSGFRVIKEEFKSANNGQIATGTFTLNLGNTEMNMMVGFLNSYNKQVSFRYEIGSRITVCNNMNVLGANYSSYRRKHMGDVDIEAFLSFDEECKKLEESFRIIKTQNEAMKYIPLNKKEMSELAGRLFIEEDIITATQLGILKGEINNPSFDYGNNNSTVFDFYQNCTHAAKSFHPADYLQGHMNLSNFIFKNYSINEGSNQLIPELKLESIKEVEYSDLVVI